MACLSQQMELFQLTESTLLNKLFLTYPDYAGYVFQNPNHQLFATSVLAELEFGPKNQGLANDEIEARVKEAADFFQLHTIINEHPLRLSFPLRKIVAMASIYAMQPSICHT